MVKVPVPAAAVMVGAPAQVFTTFGVAAITRLAGNASLNVTPLRAGDPAALVMVKVSVLTCPMPMVAGAKALVSVGVWTVIPELVTLLVIRAVAPMLALVLLYGPPRTFEVTSTVTTHEACAALIVAPVTATEPLPAAAVTIPGPDGQVVGMFGTAATAMEGRSAWGSVGPPCAGRPAPSRNVKRTVESSPRRIAAG